MAQATLQQAFDLALQHHRAGRMSQAAQLYRQILAQDPTQFGATFSLGVLELQAGRIEIGLDLICRAIAMNPGSAEAHRVLGRALIEKGDLDAAIAALKTAASLKPENAEAFSDLGSALIGKGHSAAAIAAFERCISLAPGDAAARANLGIALAKLGRLDEAAQALLAAATLSPGNPQIPYNLGNVHQEMNQLAGAIQHYRQAVALQPNYPDAQWNLGLMLLKSGDLDAGWPMYEWRFRLKGRNEPFASIPKWTGGDLRGKTLLLYGEQGYGDVIQFLRYVPVLAAMGARIVVLCHPELTRLARTISGIWAAGSPNDNLPMADQRAALMSLPGILGTRLSTIPSQVPYLSVDPVKVADWRERLPSGPNIGLCWSGRPTHPNNANRSTSLAMLSPLSELSGINWHSLQVGAASAQLAASPLKIHDHTAEFIDFAETAAFVAALDLVVTIDSAIAHLAGALAKPVWLLLPFASEWRWLKDRTDSPWYPTMRLFRQPVRGDWPSVISQCSRSLRELPTQRGTK